MKKTIGLLLTLGTIMTCAVFGERLIPKVIASSNAEETTTETNTVFSPRQSAKLIGAVYSPSKLPSGYRFEKQDLGESNVFFLWIHKTRADITFTQKPISLASATEEGGQTIEHGSFTIAYFEKDDMHIYRWQTEEYVFELSVPLEMNREDAFTIIDSVEVKHIFDFEKPEGCTEEYHYYACVTCEDCNEKRIKNHNNSYKKIDGETVISCDNCGYIYKIVED